MATTLNKMVYCPTPNTTACSSDFIFSYCQTNPFGIALNLIAQPDIAGNPMWPSTEAKRITAGMDLAVQHFELSSLKQEISTNVQIRLCLKVLFCSHLCSLLLLNRNKTNSGLNDTHLYMCLGKKVKYTELGKLKITRKSCSELFENPKNIMFE